MTIKGLTKKYPFLITWISTIWNLSYGLVQLFLAVFQHSYWYITMTAFFLILGTGRLIAASGRGNGKTVMRILSLMMVFLAVVICGMMILTIRETVYPVKNHTISIIQAAFAFSLISAAVYNVIVSHRKKDSRMIMIRDLSLASALGAVLSLERTMLGTFGVTADSFNVWITAFTGLLVFVILLLMAYSLMKTASRR